MSKDEPSGLLSKMAKFVRSPGMQWSEAGAGAKDGAKEPAKPVPDAFSKQELKDIIEQRRRNDFVRRREFDMLRKVRAAGGAAQYDGAGRPSFFETSTPSPLDDKDSTIKKIDDIEALMSEQWSDRQSGPRTRPQGPTQNAGSRDTQRDVQATAPGSLAPTAPMPLAPTEPMPLRPAGLAPLPPTAPMSLGRGPGAPEPDLRVQSKPADMISFPAPQIAPVVPAVHSVAAKASEPLRAPTPVPVEDAPGALGPKDKDYIFDVSLEEAAIRFAGGGDDAAVESTLVTRLAPGKPKAKDDEAWMTLFDLYRAIGNQARFDAAAIDYASRFEKSAPTWYSVPDLLGKPASGGGAAAQPGLPTGWTCPVIFGLQSAAALNAALQRLPQPWNLNWSKLSKIDDAAVPALEKLVASWCSGKVQLRFTGVARLLEVVAARTPNGDKAVDQGWWRLHMLLLRLMHRPDEFEVVALDFCVTYEVSPPQWEKALCSFKSLDAEGATMVALATRMNAVEPQESTQTAQPQRSLVELSGSLTGEATKAIEHIEEQLAGANMLVVSCAKLVRADFTAAGALLNWAATHQSEGRTVQFRSVNRLVAAFFHVIGINEHARILVSTH